MVPLELSSIWKHKISDLLTNTNSRLKAYSMDAIKWEGMIGASLMYENQYLVVPLLLTNTTKFKFTRK